MALMLRTGQGKTVQGSSNSYEKGSSSVLQGGWLGSTAKTNFAYRCRYAGTSALLHKELQTVLGPPDERVHE
jgi:hypothetical protein